ncbi:MAG TPA: DUF3352 domain-containing protein [Gaiellaceae bacterium]|nr:DUF3352 domain-containing protein [Gaiellaceae bacterium]
MRAIRIGLIVALALAVSGCGAKKESGSVPTGAEFAPASAPAYIALETDPNGVQWKAGERLLNKFPGREKLFASARMDLAKDGLEWSRDVVPALPPEVHIVWVDFRNDGSDIVGYAKPKDEAKFAKLIESGDDPLVHQKVEGWTVFSDTKAKIDRFLSARSNGDPLTDNHAFNDAMGKLPADAAARGWVSGESIQAAIDRAAAGSPDAQSFKSFSKEFGTLESASFSAQAEDDGIKVEAAYVAKGQQQTGNFSDELDQTLPSGALAYVSFGNLEDFLNGVLEGVDKNLPEFKTQRAQIETALGFSVKDDLFPLFSKEGALAVYSSDELVPNILFTLRVPDEAKARRIVDRLAAFAELSGKDSGLTVRDVTVNGAKGKQIGYEGQSIIAVVSDGKIFVSNSKDTLDKALGGGSKLADDEVYKKAREASGAPGDSLGFVYLNLRAGLPYIFDFVKKSDPGAITPDVTANTKPLESAFLYGKRDGDRISVSGFLTIQ